MTVKASVEKVTAQTAIDLLSKTEELGFHNRRLSMPAVLKYSRIMLRGGWELNGETIIVDEEGALINGQHRMHAVIEADVGETGPPHIEMLVARGVPRETFRTMDQGFRRTAGQILGMEGVGDGNKMAALVRAIHVWHSNRHVNKAVGRELDNREITEEVQAHAEQYRACIAYGRRAAPLFGQPSAWAFVHWLLTEHAGEEALDLFLEPLITGSGLGSDSPVLALRNKLITARGRQVKFTDKQLITMVVRCWNAVRGGRALARVPLPRTEDEVPELR